MKWLVVFLFLFSSVGRADLYFNAQGVNADIDTGTEDLTPVAVTLEAAAATKILSSDVNDDGSPVGTGARTVRVWGLNTDNLVIEETATMNGTSDVTLTKAFKRVNMIEVLTAGSNASPVGNITVQHGATVIGQLGAGSNRSRVTYFSSPASQNCAIKRVRASITNAVVGIVTFSIQTRKSGGTWQSRWSAALQGVEQPNVNDDLSAAPIVLVPGEDAKMVGTATADNSAVVGSYDLRCSSGPVQ